MAQTFFHDFTNDSGIPVTVEYQMDGETVASIIKCWPNTPEHDELHKALMNLDWAMLQGKSIRELRNIFDDDARKERIDELHREIERDEDRVELTDAERERMESWLSENHVHDEPCDEWVF